jgi:hypothetical protein
MAEIFPINGAPYECEFQLKDDKGEVKSDFTKSAIKYLDLSENLLEPFTDGLIAINNPYDFIDNSLLTRGDGRDQFTFSLKPEDGEEDSKLEYNFVLDKEHNSVAKIDRAGNYKAYTLLDSNYFKLNEKIPYGKRYRGPVGDIIKSILKEIISEDIVDEENFEPGDNVIDIFPEHIIPPDSFRYTDLLKYLLQINYKKEKGLHVRSFLKFDRKSRKYTLKTLSKIFEKNKENIMEGFAANDLVDEVSSNKNNPPPDADVNPYISQLPQTNFTTPMLNFSNEFFMNYKAVGYDPILGEHNIREKRIKDIKKIWEKNFVEVFKSEGGKPKAFLPLNKQKKENLFRTISTPFSVEKSANIAEAEMSSNLIFYNLCLSINVVGDTKREAGKFIDIFRTAKQVGSDKKLLGRWLVTKTRHRFFGDRYQNYLECVKTYVGPDSKIEDDID